MALAGRRRAVVEHMAEMSPAAAAMLLGVILLLSAVRQWAEAAFGPLDYATTMRWVVPGVTLTALGFQTVLSSFFMSILGMNRR